MATIIAGGSVWRIRVDATPDGRWRASVAKGLGKPYLLALAYDSAAEAEDAAAAAVLRMARQRRLAMHG